MISQKELKRMLAYDQELGLFTWKISPNNFVKIGQVAGNDNGNGYLTVRLHRRSYLVHRLVWLYCRGYFPGEIDHINRIKGDNRIENLRESSRTLNLRNTGNPANNKSGVKGVFFRKAENKWIASITIDNNRMYLGYHADFTEAVCHRLAAEQFLGWAGCDDNSQACQYMKNYLRRKHEPVKTA